MTKKRPTQTKIQWGSLSTLTTAPVAPSHTANGEPPSISYASLLTAGDVSARSNGAGSSTSKIISHNQTAKPNSTQRTVQDNGGLQQRQAQNSGNKQQQKKTKKKQMKNTTSTVSAEIHTTATTTTTHGTPKNTCSNSSNCSSSSNHSDFSSLVVHCKRSEYDVYIGRRNPSIPAHRTFDFKWGNPFKIGPDGNRDDVIRKYDEWIRSRPDLMRLAKEELKGKVLACWCSPEACHGDVLARIANT
mgnify:CR=1 FL=1